MVGFMQARLHHEKGAIMVLEYIHKYGVELPCNVQEAFEIDCQSGTDFW